VVVHVLEKFGKITVILATLVVPRNARAQPFEVDTQPCMAAPISSGLYLFWGPYLAARGYQVLAINYRLVTESPKSLRRG
jgi:hypothetical protein